MLFLVLADLFRQRQRLGRFRSELQTERNKSTPFFETDLKPSILSQSNFPKESAQSWPLNIFIKIPIAVETLPFLWCHENTSSAESSYDV